MKTFGWIERLFIAWLAFATVQFFLRIVIPTNAPDAPNIGYVLASDFLIVLALSFPAARSDWRKWRLALALAAMPLGITAADMIEATAFLKLWTFSLPLRQILSFALVSPLWAAIFGGWRCEEHRHNPLPSRSLFQTLWRFLVCDAAYLVLYIVAGVIAFPYVRAFYSSRALPSLGELATLQLLARGPLFVCLCLLLLRMLHLTRMSASLAVGGIFTTISAIAPLAIPNPYLPDAVRWVHFFQVTTSNFLFGAFVGWIWGDAELPSRLISETP